MLLNKIECSNMVFSLFQRSCCEPNPFDSVIQAVTHKLIHYYVEWRTGLTCTSKASCYSTLFVVGASSDLGTTAQYNCDNESKTFRVLDLQCFS